MAGHTIELGVTGKAVQANIIVLRRIQNLTYAELSRRLKAAGRDIPNLALRRIEKGQRRIDVDDLVAFSCVFGVSPIELLRPNTWSVEIKTEGSN